MTQPISTLSFSARMALFLDFDGTLAPLQDKPDNVFITAEQSKLLVTCADKLGGALALISGRDMRDLAKRSPQEVWRSGNHGLYVCAPNSVIPVDLPGPPESIMQSLTSLIEDMDGVWLERKGPVIAIHFRNAPEFQNIIIKSVDDILARRPDYKRQHGHMIVEAKPVAANKGYFIRDQMRHKDFSGRIPVMMGDDTTDEDAFAAAQELGGIAVKVGDGATCAKYRAVDVSEIYTFLRSAL